MYEQNAEKNSIIYLQGIENINIMLLYLELYQYTDIYRIGHRFRDFANIG